MIKERLAGLWRKYNDVWDWLVDIGGTKVGGFILAFSFFVGVGLMIGFIISELMR